MKVPTGNVSQRRGIAAVETAVIAPFLFLLLFGVWEVGRLIEMDQVVNNACREGARQSSTGTINSTASTFTVQNYVANYLQNAGLAYPPATATISVENVTQNLTSTTTANLNSSNPDNLVVQQSGGAPANDPVTTANPGDMLLVTVQYPFATGRWSPVNSFFYLGTINITAKSEWMCLKDQPIVVDSTIPSSP